MPKTDQKTGDREAAGSKGDNPAGRKDQEGQRKESDNPGKSPSQGQKPKDKNQEQGQAGKGERGNKPNAQNDPTENPNRRQDEKQPKAGAERNQAKE